MDSSNNSFRTSGSVADTTAPAQQADQSCFKAYKASRSDLYWLGISVVLGGQVIDWSYGLRMGYWEFFLSFLLMGLGYFCLTLCLAEMASMLPFAGGSYGYVRCALGPTWGFLVGYCEAIEYIMYVAATVVTIGELFHDLLRSSRGLLPVYWLLFYALVLPCQGLGGACTWKMAVVLGVATMLTLATWCLLDIDEADINKYPENKNFGGSAFSFLKFFPYAAWFYKGIEVMTLTCRNIEEPARKVPRTMLWLLLSVFLIGLCVLLTAGSVAPGPHELSNEDRTLDPLLLHALHVGRQLGSLFMLPGAVGTAYGFMFAFSQQLHSMASSGLLPACLRRTHGQYRTPYVALLVGSALSFLCVLGLYLCLGGRLREITRDLFEVSLLGSCAVDISLLCAYRVYRSRYSNLQRVFRNPLGCAATYVGIAIFSFLGICLAFFAGQHVSIVFFVVSVSMGALYYFGVARQREFFSQEEQEQFMKAYILNANSRKKRSHYAKQRSPSSSFSSGKLRLPSLSIQLSLSWSSAQAVAATPTNSQRKADGGSREASARSAATALVEDALSTAEEDEHPDKKDIVSEDAH